MRSFNKGSARWGEPSLLALLVTGAVGLAATTPGGGALPASAVTQEQVMRGRLLVVSHDCGGCHSGGNGSNPSGARWLSGIKEEIEAFQIGPFKTRPRNLTPDNTT